MGKTSVEYATDQITIYRYCNYRCRYCWAWRLPIFTSRIKRGKYDPVEEARKYLRITGRRVIVVSFTSDPYPWDEVDKMMTRRVLGVLANARQHRVLILTKNPTLALRDTDLMKKHGDMWLGSTVISIDKNDWEPYAPTPKSRILALSIAHDDGVKTWMSIEPIIPGVTKPEEIIKETWEYVDYYVLGSLNYPRQLKLPFTEAELKRYYMEHIPRAVRLLRELDKKYTIKKELKRYVGEL